MVDSRQSQNNKRRLEIILIYLKVKEMLKEAERAKMTQELA